MAIPVYLWLIDDEGHHVKGAVDVKGREGSIEIVAFMHNVELPTDDRTGRITSKRVQGDYFLVKETDCSSPYLYQGLSTGKKFKEAILKFYRINYNGRKKSS